MLILVGVVVDGDRKVERARACELNVVIVPCDEGPLQLHGPPSPLPDTLRLDPSARATGRAEDFA
jgi:hypothetical protein